MLYNDTIDFDPEHIVIQKENNNNVIWLKSLLDLIYVTKFSKNSGPILSLYAYI